MTIEQLMGSLQVYEEKKKKRQNIADRLLKTKVKDYYIPISYVSFSKDNQING